MARKKRKYPKMIRYCEKCGALQKPDKKNLMKIGLYMIVMPFANAAVNL